MYLIRYRYGDLNAVCEPNSLLALSDKSIFIRVNIVYLNSEGRYPEVGVLEA